MAWKDLLRNLRPPGKPVSDAAHESAVEKARAWSPVASPHKNPATTPPPPVESGSAFPSTQASVMPGLAARQKGDPLHQPGKIVVSDREDTAYRRKTSAIEFIQKRYQPFGDQVASTVLIYALQPRGIQRLVARLGSDPHNNDPLDHEEVLRYLQEEGVNSFCQKVGVRTGSTDSPPPVDASPGDLDTRPTPDPRPRTAPQAIRPTPSGKGVSPVLKLEGQQFQPVRIQADAQRRGALGKASAADSSTGGQTVERKEPRTPLPPKKAPLARASALPPSGEKPTADGKKEKKPAETAKKPPSKPADPSVPSPGPSSVVGTPPAPKVPVSSKANRPTTKYPGLWQPRTTPSNEDTQELAPRKPAVRPPSSPPAAKGDPAANEFLRRMVNQHTRDFLERGGEPTPPGGGASNVDPPTVEES